jgi:hypothetical protein
MKRTQLETRDWSPLLTQPQQRHRAQEIIDHISRVLAQAFDADTTTDGPRAAFGSTSVMGGLPHLALLYAYRFAENGDETDGNWRSRF